MRNAQQCSHFYPRPLRRGRLSASYTFRPRSEFLSTPSSQRATAISSLYCSTHVPISIHALFAEGDLPHHRRRRRNRHFYPRPLRRGRRELTDQANAWLRFLSTPSSQRATERRPLPANFVDDFYPRPLRRGRPSAARSLQILWTISIHALFAEGDMAKHGCFLLRCNFYPRPLRRGRRHRNPAFICARENFYPRPLRRGRHQSSQEESLRMYFYPRPLRRGRHDRGHI